MNKILTISSNTFLEAVRSKVLLSIILVSFFMIAVSGLFGSVSIGETTRVIKSFGYFLISLSGTITAIISATSLFQKELVQKTIYNILSKSVSREQFILGKVIGLWLTSVTAVFIMLILLQVGLYVFEQKLDPLFIQGFLCMSFELLIIVSATVFFSTMSITPVLPGLFALALYISGKSIFYLKYFINQESTSILLKDVVLFLDKIVPDLHVLTPYDNLVYGIPLEGSVLIKELGYSLSYSGFLVLLSFIIFSRRDL